MLFCLARNYPDASLSLPTSQSGTGTYCYWVEFQIVELELTQGEPAWASHRPRSPTLCSVCAAVWSFSTRIFAGRIRLLIWRRIACIRDRWDRRGSRRYRGTTEGGLRCSERLTLRGLANAEDGISQALGHCDVWLLMIFRTIETSSNGLRDRFGDQRAI